jgi:hypothetical protein
MREAVMITAVKSFVAQALGVTRTTSRAHVLILIHFADPAQPFLSKSYPKTLIGKLFGSQN